MNENRKIRVLIAEDSTVNQKLLAGILAEDPEFEVIGIVNNGSEAVDFVSANMPDVVSMDLNMPVLDGYAATRLIMKRSPVPIVIVSSFFKASEAGMMLKVLEVGALTILPKPNGPGHPDYRQTARSYRNTLRVMSEVEVRVITRLSDSLHKSKTGAPHKPAPAGPAVVYPATPGRYKVIAVGASAGGPQVIQFILQSLPSTTPVPVLIVQHIDANFSDGYCDWLSSTSNLPVHRAVHGERMLPGHVYLPPGDRHLGVLNPGFVALSSEPPERGLRPAVSILFRDVLKFYGKNSICIILSGMGADGAAELKLLHDNGAYTIAQDAQSSVVHGMPGEAIRMGGATAVLAPKDIVTEILHLLQKTV
jgi:two-component system chemotaxis response regulator CheB